MDKLEQEIEEAYKEWLIDRHNILTSLDKIVSDGKCGKLTYIEPEMCERIIDFIERSRF